MVLVSSTALTFILPTDGHDIIRYEDKYSTKLNRTKMNEMTTAEARNLPRREFIEEALEYATRRVEELYEIKEPAWYNMGLYLNEKDPGRRLSSFSSPSPLTDELIKMGYTSLFATEKLYSNNPTLRTLTPESISLRSLGLNERCPTLRKRRCTTISKRYRTIDGSCNNLKAPWMGSAMMPMHRLLPPNYDGVQNVRKSSSGKALPSPREISNVIHAHGGGEDGKVTLMFMQWGQFLAHDVAASAQATAFKKSTPRCCQMGGRGFLPRELTHPSCLPIEVSPNDPFYSKFNTVCMEFVRSAPTTSIDCNLGWREQINQVTSFIDASPVYGSHQGRAETTRELQGGRLRIGGPAQLAPNHPAVRACLSGAISAECFARGDHRAGEQPGLTAFHVVWVRLHNGLAATLAERNPHWTDEKTYQETRKIVGALVQHVTYNEFLPVLLGQEVVKMFELYLEKNGYYRGYDDGVDPTVANAFATAAFRFGHSLVPNTFVRADSKHRHIFNNVSLHKEESNINNIWQPGSLDRLLLGFANQPSQKRDEHLSEELTDHLFHSPGRPFGIDLASINIQRGRDHGLQPYTSWREPCGLSPIKNWEDLRRVMLPTAAERFEKVYEKVEDIDLFSGGLAEKPVRGGIVGPTFACIIAEQFTNLRKGDRFWYENDGLNDAFTPAQLQQIRRVSFAQVLCMTTDGIETIQPFVFLAGDDDSNARVPCEVLLKNSINLTPWTDLDPDNNDVKTRTRRWLFDGTAKKNKKTKNRTTTTPLPRTTKRRKIPTTRTATANKRRTTTERPLKIQITNITSQTIQLNDKNSNRLPTYRPQIPNYRPDYDDVTYLFGLAPTYTTPLPLEVNINVQYNKFSTIRPDFIDPYLDRPITLYDYAQTDRYKPTKNPTTKHPQILTDFNKIKTTTKRYPVRKRPQKSTTPKYPTYIFSDNTNSQTNTKRRTTKRPTKRRPYFKDKLPESFLYQGTRNFVKISSVRGKLQPNSEYVEEYRARENDNLYEENSEPSQIVKVDVLPRETRVDEWEVFEEDNENTYLDTPIVPEMTKDIPFTDELPRPMTF